MSFSFLLQLDEIGHLYMFAAKYYSKGVVQLSQDLLNRVIGYLTLHNEPSSAKGERSTDPTHKQKEITHRLLSERQGHLLAILKRYPSSSLDTERILQLAEGCC